MMRRINWFHLALRVLSRLFPGHHIMLVTWDANGNVTFQADARRDKTYLILRALADSIESDAHAKIRAQM